MVDRNGRRPGPRWRRGLQIAAACIVVLIGAFAVGSAVAGPFFWYSCSLDGLQIHGPARASVLLSRDGKRLGLLGASGARIPVSLPKVSPALRKAIVDTEDRRFYDNNGIDYIGILRALRSDVTSGQFAQGASTIEQQLVRNLYLDPQQSLGRKVREGCLAVQLDRRWSKDRILTAYLNDIYFGHQAYGIEAAARTYFGVHAKNLSLEQAALLAGLPQAPSAYDPISRPGAARTRRAEVLKAMVQAGDLSRRRYRRAVHRPLGLRPRQAPGLSRQTYLSDFITSQLIDQYGAERIRRGGLHIYTTLDLKMQTAATRAIRGTLDRKEDPAGSVVSIDPDTGQIRAMAIAQTGKRISFDVAADGQRQAGSTFKMFVLTQAVQRKINPWSTKYLSAPFLERDNTRIQTFEHTYYGRIPLTKATLLSDNTVFARLTLDVGPKPVADLAEQMGIQSHLKPVPTIGLGANAISPLDLASAYATLAAGGVAHQPTILTKVVFPGGRTVGASRPRGKRVVDEKVAAVVTRILAANVRSGTGTAAALAGRPVAGKTGTTDSFADAWFAGWVPQLTTVAWVGYPTNERPMRNVHGIAGVTGGTLPAQMWHAYMTAALHGQPVEQFASSDAPPYKPWCGRYEFARTWRDARKQDGSCKKHKKKARTTTAKTTTKRKTTTAKTTTVHTTTRTTTLPGTTTTPPPTTTAPPATTTTTPTTTTTATTTTTPTTTTAPTTTPRPDAGNRLGRPVPPQHLCPPLVLVDKRRGDLRPARPPRQRHAALFRELLEHGRAEGVQPLVLGCDLAGQLIALGLPLGHIVLDLEQAVPVADAFLDGAGHAALLLHFAVPTDAAVVLAESSSESRIRAIPRTSVSR
jgi:penicillin-binding protein 1A